MEATLNKTLTYVDAVFPAGSVGQVLNRKTYRKLEKDERNALWRAKAMYEKRKIRGLFLQLGSKYRWVDEIDFTKTDI